MTTSAVVMMVFAMILMWGGAAICIGIATKNRDK
ncbi:MetS family NSS transporter small subunit [Desulfofalx alkaliphila]|nr:MetS family NSS transporter small subunit [Desulfofalx alkaliphila]